MISRDGSCNFLFLVNCGFQFSHRRDLPWIGHEETLEDRHAGGLHQGEDGNCQHLHDEQEEVEDEEVDLGEGLPLLCDCSLDQLPHHRLWNKDVR